MSCIWNAAYPMVLTGVEARVIWTGAVRYAMHRGTGGARMTADAVRAHLADLDDGTLEIIARDIRREAEAWGEESVGRFAGLPDEIDAELERRKHGYERRAQARGVRDEALLIAPSLMSIEGVGDAT